MLLIRDLADFRAGRPTDVYVYPTDTDVPTDDAGRAYVSGLADKLANLYAHNGWAWSGAVPMCWEIEYRVWALIRDATSTLADDATRSVATISGGRLSVEARRTGELGTAVAVTVSVQFGADSL